MEKKKRRWGDRYDGWRVRNKDPLLALVPRIMPLRTTSANMFDEVLDIEPVDRYVHRKRAEGMSDLRAIHVIMAAIVRVLSQKPRMNRFIIGKKIYARNNIRLALIIKKSMNLEGEETPILPYFEPEDTLREVVQKTNAEIAKILVEKEDNATDLFTKFFHFVPGFLITFVVFLARNLDKVGLLPRFVQKASPFHCSLFITDLGSLGVTPAYHHLYEFGTCSIFLALGQKEKVPCFVDKEHLTEKKVIGLRFVLDERICDGFYFATAIKMFRRILKKPEVLELPPENTYWDDEI